MQITLSYTCRECGRDQELHTDTSEYGILAVGDPGPTDQIPFNCITTGTRRSVKELSCQCGHVSGLLGLGYNFKEEHRPSWEQRPIWPAGRGKGDEQ